MLSTGLPRWFRGMPRIRALAILVAAPLTASTAQAQQGAIFAAPVAAEQPAPQPRLGVMVDAGLPDGATGSLVYRPLWWLRTELGGGYNLISKSVRGGASLIPFGAGPSATLEAGRFFEGDANGFARTIAGAGFKDKAVLDRVGYDYVNAHLGLDFGARRVTFFIHGGMSYIRATVHDVNTQIADSTSLGGSSTTTLTFNQDPVVKAFVPSFKLGLIVYIW